MQLFSGVKIAIQVLSDQRPKPHMHDVVRQEMLLALAEDSSICVDWFAHYALDSERSIQ